MAYTQYSKNVCNFKSIQDSRHPNTPRMYAILKVHRMADTQFAKNVCKFKSSQGGRDIVRQ